MASDKVIIVTKENFEQEVLKSDKPVLVDFWAQWCGPCRAVAPIIDELADGYEDRVKVCKLNVDDQDEIATQYGIMSIPTVILFKEGQIKGKVIGARPKIDFVNILERNM